MTFTPKKITVPLVAGRSADPGVYETLKQFQAQINGWIDTEYGVHLNNQYAHQVRGVIVPPWGKLTGQTGRIILAELVSNGYNTVGLRAPDALAATVEWVLPTADGGAGTVLSTDGAGNLSFVAVSSLPAGNADTLDGYHATAFCFTGDTRLSDARTPLGHKDTHKTGGTDALTYGDIGAAASVHYHSWSDLTSGVPAFGTLALENGSSIGMSLIPSLTDTWDLGSAAKLWRFGYISTMMSTVFSLATQTLSGGYSTVGYRAGAFAATVTDVATTADFGITMTPGHFVVVRALDTGGTSRTEYFQVGTLVSGTTYNVTRALSGDGPYNWAAGTPFLVLGTTGIGRLDLYAYDGKPRLSVVEQGATYGAATERVRVGNLEGWGLYGANVYGAAFGDPTGDNVTIDPTNGVRMTGALTTGGGDITLDTNGVNIKYAGTSYTPNRAYKLSAGSDTIGAMWGWKLTSPIAQSLFMVGTPDPLSWPSTVLLQSTTNAGYEAQAHFIAVSGSTNTGVQLYADSVGPVSKILFLTSTATRVTIDKDGLVGIGGSPETNLHVAGTTTNVGVRVQHTSAGGSGWDMNANADGTWRLSQAGVADRLFVSTTGLVGINDTAPPFRLTVRDASNPYVFVTDVDLSGNKYGALLKGYAVTAEGGYAALGVANNSVWAQGLLVDPSGHVRIGTGTGLVTPLLEVKGANTCPMVIIEDTNSYCELHVKGYNGGDSGLRITGDRTWKVGVNLGAFGAGIFGIYDITGSAQRLTIDTSGHVNVVGGTLKVRGTQVVSTQGAAVADATDAATVITQLNALLARLRTHGLIAT